MKINLEYAASAQAAPQSYRDAVQQAASILEATFSNAVTLNITVNVGSYTDASGAHIMGLSDFRGVPLAGNLYRFSPALTQLPSGLYSYDPGIMNTLYSGVDYPESGAFQNVSVPGSYIRVWSAQEKAFGLAGPATTGIDGEIDLGSGLSGNLLVAASLNTLTKAMGRTAGIEAGQPDVFDVSRYGSYGTHLLGATTPATGNQFVVYSSPPQTQVDYSSINPSDFSNSSLPNDAFDQALSSSTVPALSSVDIQQMQALGFHVPGVKVYGLPSKVASDFDNDRVSDIAVRNPVSGDYGYLSLNSSDVATWHDVSSIGTAYTPIGAGPHNGPPTMAFENMATGSYGFLSANSWWDLGKVAVGYAGVALADFNGDGLTDIAFRNAATGDWGYMALGVNSTYQSPGPPVWHGLGWSAPSYAPIGAGDFDGDGHQELAFRDPVSGGWGFFSINGATTTWHDMGWSSPAYTAVGPGDFNGDGVTDMAFRNNANGDVGYFLLDTTGVAIWHDLGFSDPSYKAVGVGDFNGDGLSDISFLNPSTQALAYVAVNSSGLGAWHNITTPNRYAFLGAGDLNRDGSADMVMRDPTTGNWGYLALDAAGGANWHGQGWASPDYAMTGRGDFDGDGVADVAFRNPVNGDWGYMSVGTVTDFIGYGAFVATPAQSVLGTNYGQSTWHALGWSSPAYAAIGAGDFNGDGRTDMAFRNNGSGDWGYYTVSGGASAWHPLGWSSPAYVAIGAGDFNGDGVTDMAFRNNATGDWGFMALDRAGNAVWHDVGFSSTAYTAIGAGDFNGDGVADMAFRNAGSGDWGYMSLDLSGNEAWRALGFSSVAYAPLGAGDFNGDGVSDMAFTNPATGDMGFLQVSGLSTTWHDTSAAAATAYFVI